MKLDDLLAARRGRPVDRPPRPRPTSYLRRFTLATAAFAIAIILGIAGVAYFILKDLSASYVSEVLGQAQGEAEAFARMVNSPAVLDGGELQDTLKGGPGDAFDADAVLSPLAGVYEQDGRPARLPDGPAATTVEPGDPLARRGSGELPSPPTRPTAGRTPAQLSTSGQELQYFLNGQLIGRDIVQYLEIAYPGGRKRHLVRTIDQKDFDPAALQAPGTIVERVPIQYRPNTRRVFLSWDTELQGQAVKIRAGIDADVLDAGAAELRRKIVPKVVVGSAAFLLLLVAGYAYVFRLLREARLLEAEANQKALLAQVGMLAAGLAHEIRNPLSAVNMNLQLLEEDLSERRARHGASEGAEAGAAADDDVALLRSTQREIRRLATLVSDFLAYARPGEPRRAPVVLDAVVRDCVDLFAPLASGQGVELSVRLQSGERPVLLDEAMIKQALMNVVLNAIQAVPKPGGRVRIASSRAAGACEIVVEDDGPGLPEDVEPLFQVFHSTKKGGSGLGLAISRALVERHGGRLTARPGAAGGAVFTIVVPTESPA